MNGDKSLKYFFRFSLLKAQARDYECVSFSKPPRLLGIYDVNYKHITPAKTLKYFMELTSSQYPLDLNENAESFCRMVPSTEDNLLRALLLPSAIAIDEESVERISVLTRSGILRRIMEFCYGRRDFCALISRFNGKLYMIREETAINEFKGSQNKSYHHARLNHLLFVDKPGGSPNLENVCDDNIFQVFVRQINLGKFNISYVGRIQGIVADEIFENWDDLEAVNDLHFTFSKQMWNELRYNTLKSFNYWLSCHLANVNDFYAAYKNGDGVVERPIECLKTSDILQNSSMNPDICTTFLNEFLEKVEELMSDVNSLDTVYKFHFNTNGKTIHYKVYEGKTEMSFVPKEFADHIN